MTKIDWAPQLDYNNDLIRPKRSSLVSRSQVNLERTFVYSKNIESLNVDNSNEWKGIPIIISGSAIPNIKQRIEALFFQVDQDWISEDNQYLNL